MTISEHVKEFAGRRVEDWSPGHAIDPAVALRLAIGYEEEQSFSELVEALAGTKGAGKLEALVVGPWSGELYDCDSADVVEALAAASDKLTGLRALFVGDIIFEESEISWLHQSDMGPLLAAYPKLEVFQVRGGQDLAFNRMDHAALRELCVQTGGLGADVVAQILGGRLPALERLELWLGVDDYGGDTTVEDLAPLFAGDRFPKLRSLGLRDTRLADEIAAAVATAPVLARLEELDLSMGTLGDEGAKALLASPGVRKLKKLDLHHNYLSEEMIKALHALPGVKVDTSGTEEADDEEDRYVSVSE